MDETSELQIGVGGAEMTAGFRADSVPVGCNSFASLRENGGRRERAVEEKTDANVGKRSGWQP